MNLSAATGSASVAAARYQSSATCEVIDGCITCGDTAVEMEIVRIDHARELALCECDAGRETVEIALVAPVAVGDRLLVHAGTAIAHLGREEAA